jgi:hypothetical protein
MKPLPNSWKPYFLLLSIALLVVTVVSDQYRPSSEPMDHDSDHSHDPGHSHEHAGSPDSPNSLDKAFSKAPDPGAIPIDPVREHRMAIFHYNEGNKFLKKDWGKAVENYKMALHHDPALSPAYINMSSAYIRGQQYAKARQTLETLKTYAPDHPALYYNLACYFSLTHQEKESLEALEKSFQLGYKNRGDVHIDPDLANLRQTPEFQQWVKTL